MTMVGTGVAEGAGVLVGAGVALGATVLVGTAVAGTLVAVGGGVLVAGWAPEQAASSNTVTNDDNINTLFIFRISNPSRLQHKNKSTTKCFDTVNTSDIYYQHIVTGM
jgi:hypothetical protein